MVTEAAKTVILLSCFEPFGGDAINSSLEVCRHLEQEGISDLKICLLPVVWKSAPEALLKEIERWKPRIVLAFGQAKRQGIALETQAENLDDFRIPDNAGQQIQAQKIIDSAPKYLPSTLPLEELLECLRKDEIPAALSHSAGTFVCNHLFFHLQNALLEKEILSGFIHLPILPTQAKDEDFSMPLEVQVKALKSMIEVLASGL